MASLILYSQVSLSSQRGKHRFRHRAITKTLQAIPVSVRPMDVAQVGHEDVKSEHETFGK